MHSNGFDNAPVILFSICHKVSVFIYVNLRIHSKRSFGPRMSYYDDLGPKSPTVSLFLFQYYKSTIITASNDISGYLILLD